MGKITLTYQGSIKNEKYSMCVEYSKKAGFHLSFPLVYKHIKYFVSYLLI